MDSPTWSDIYSISEMSAALRMAAARIARNAGGYALAEEINFAADCIEELADQRDKAVAMLDEMKAGLDRLEVQTDHAMAAVQKLLM